MSVKITDEMVERARKLYERNVDSTLSRATTKAMLNAALNPPEEPEIVVTYDMMTAGMNASGPEGWDVLPQVNAGQWVAKMYRAMRKLEPKPCDHVWSAYAWFELGPGSSARISKCVQCGTTKRR